MATPQGVATQLDASAAARGFRPPFPSPYSPYPRPRPYPYPYTYPYPYYSPYSPYSALAPVVNSVMNRAATVPNPQYLFGTSTSVLCTDNNVTKGLQLWLQDAASRGFVNASNPCEMRACNAATSAQLRRTPMAYSLWGDNPLRANAMIDNACLQWVGQVRPPYPYNPYPYGTYGSGFGTLEPLAPPYIIGSSRSSSSSSSLPGKIPVRRW